LESSTILARGPPPKIGLAPTAILRIGWCAKATVS
jgi:hypothetical protein